MLWIANGIAAFAIAHGIYVATTNHENINNKDKQTDYWDVTPYRIAGFVLACLLGPLTWIAVATTLVIAIIEFKSFLGVKMFNLRDVLSRATDKSKGNL